MLQQPSGHGGHRSCGARPPPQMYQSVHSVASLATSAAGRSGPSQLQLQVKAALPRQRALTDPAKGHSLSLPAHPPRMQERATPAAAANWRSAVGSSPTALCGACGGLPISDLGKAPASLPFSSPAARPRSRVNGSVVFTSPVTDPRGPPKAAPVESSEALDASLESAALPPASPAPTTPLKEGVAVQIDGKRFEISSPLGTGSYGIVWSAREEREGSGGGETACGVAVKEILCQSQAELTNALFEGDLLFRLSAGGSSASSSAPFSPNGGARGPGPAGSSAFSPRTPGTRTSLCQVDACLSARIPSLVAQEAESLGPQKWRMRLAMSRIPGEPLVLLLHRQWHRAASLEDTVPRGTAAEALRLLAEPCRVASELLAQLGPALNELNLFAYHRDINPRNILVDGLSGQGLRGPISFGLVDFGMAVDARQWRGSGAVEDGAWRHLEVGGDCRYWPLSSWIMFLRGPQ
ncbi:unnamed protein product, partial [Polarella glacialis]